MKTIKIKIENNTKNSVTILNAVTFEVANKKKINKEKLTEAFAGAVCRRWQDQQMAKEMKGAGGRVKFSSTGALNMVVQIDNEEEINLNNYTSETGDTIKFPSHAAHKYGLRQAREILLFDINRTFDNAEMFNDEIKTIFE